jgi:hypothetical protein
MFIIVFEARIHPLLNVTVDRHVSDDDLTHTVITLTVQHSLVVKAASCIHIIGPEDAEET